MATKTEIEDSLKSVNAAIKSVAESGVSQSINILGVTQTVTRASISELIKIKNELESDLKRKNQPARRAKLFI